MSQEESKSNPFKFKILDEGDFTVLEASGDLDATHPKVIVTGLMKMAADGKKKIILEMSGASELPLKYLAELANGCQKVKSAGGDVLMVGLPEKSSELISSSKAGAWVGVAPTKDEAEKYFESLEDDGGDLLSGEELEKALEALRADVSQLDIGEGREIRRKNAFLKQRVSELKDLIKGWQAYMPAEGTLPETDSFFRAESSLIRMAAQRELIPMETFKELLHRWTDLTGEEIDLEGEA